MPTPVFWLWEGLLLGYKMCKQLLLLGSHGAAVRLVENMLLLGSHGAAVRLVENML